MKVLFKNKEEILNVKLSVNDQLNDFVVVDSKMNEIHFNEIKGLKIILTVPSVDTRVCSMELGKFVEYLKDMDVKLISISMDLPFALDRWCQNNSENIIATSDFRYHDFDSVSGLLMKNVGLFSRSVILVDENNRIKYMEIVENTHTEPNYQKVLELIRA